MRNFRRRRKSRESDGSGDSSLRNSTPPRKCGAISLNMIGIQNMIVEAANLLKNIKKEFNEKVGMVKEKTKSQQKLDDDEDHRKSQYIPKHDDTDSTATESRVVKEEKNNKDMTDKWLHDRYNDEEQVPKSCSELIAVYGYDIREEELEPPIAHKRRRYGWGRKSYAPNWKNDDAHRKKKDKTDRWNHDKYNNEEQASKSCAELIAEYGYNIRGREGPFKAH